MAHILKIKYLHSRLDKSESVQAGASLTVKVPRERVADDLLQVLYLILAGRCSKRAINP